MPVDAAASVPPAPPAAAAVFGAALDAAVEFARLLCSDGVVRGLIGPREPDRIWSRHLLNCGVVAELFAAGERVVDVGSGAGLPGIALALARPDISVDLLEPLQRRVDFLELAVDRLGLAARVRVVRGRAEERSSRSVVGGAEWVTARAVAPLDRLVGWCLPLVKPGGRLALMKGSSAATELDEHRAALGRLGARELAVRSCGTGVLEAGVTVVTMARKG